MSSPSPSHAKFKMFRVQGLRSASGVVTRGFSLIELLVVITIIAILSSMLMVCIGMVRSAANSSVCLNQLRQMSIGVQVYAGDNDGLLPQVNFTWWDRQSAPLAVVSKFATLAQTQLNERKNILVCPSDKRPDGDPVNNEWGGYSSKSCMWGDYATSSQKIQSSYCYNVEAFAPERWERDANGGIPPRNIESLPIARAMFWDSPNLMNSSRGPMGLNLHRNGVNMVFIDGSARWYSFGPALPGEIWMSSNTNGRNAFEVWWGETRRSIGPGVGCQWIDHLAAGRGEPWN